jgi:hypothetical protein
MAAVCIILTQTNYLTKSTDYPILTPNIISFFLSYPEALQFLENLGRLLMGDSKTGFPTVGRTAWTRARPVASPLLTRGSTTQKDEDKHPRLQWESNPRSQYSSGQDSRLNHAATKIGNCICWYHRTKLAGPQSSNGLSLSVVFLLQLL